MSDPITNYIIVLLIGVLIGVFISPKGTGGGWFAGPRY